MKISGCLCGSIIRKVGLLADSYEANYYMRTSNTDQDRHGDLDALWRRLGSAWLLALVIVLAHLNPTIQCLSAPPDHPRLFFDRKVLNDLRIKANDDQAKQSFDAALSYASWAAGIPFPKPTDYRPSDDPHLSAIMLLEGRAENLAFSWLMTRNAYGVDDQNLPQLASQLVQASKQLSQTIIVTHHGICEEDATNILNVRVGQDGISQIAR